MSRDEHDELPTIKFFYQIKGLNQDVPTKIKKRVWQKEDELGLERTKFSDFFDGSTYEISVDNARAQMWLETAFAEYGLQYSQSTEQGKGLGLFSRFLTVEKQFTQGHWVKRRT